MLTVGSLLVIILSCLLLSTLAGGGELLAPYTNTKNVTETNDLSNEGNPDMAAIRVTTGELYFAYATQALRSLVEIGSTIVVVSPTELQTGTRSFEPLFIPNAFNVKIPNNLHTLPGDSEFQIVYENGADLFLDYLTPNLNNRTISLDISKRKLLLDKLDSLSVIEYNDDVVVTGITELATEIVIITEYKDPMTPDMVVPVPIASNVSALAIVEDCFILASNKPMDADEVLIRAVVGTNVIDIDTVTLDTLAKQIILTYNELNNTLLLQIVDVDSILYQFAITTDCSTMDAASGAFVDADGLFSGVEVFPSNEATFITLFQLGSVNFFQVALYPFTVVSFVEVPGAATAVRSLKGVFDSDNCVVNMLVVSGNGDQFVFFLTPTTGAQLIFICTKTQPAPPTAAPMIPSTLPPTLAPLTSPVTDAPTTVNTTIECVDSTCLDCASTMDMCSFNDNIVVNPQVVVTIDDPTVVQGNFINNGDVVLVIDDQESTTLTVEGCLVIQPNSSFVIDISGVDTSSDTVIKAIESPCIIGEENINVTNHECVETQQQRSTTGLSLLIFTDDCNGSISMGVIIGATVGGLILLIIIFFVVVFFIPPLRKAVLPWSLRKARQRET